MLDYDINIQPTWKPPRTANTRCTHGIELLSVVVRFCRSPQYTAPGCVPTGGAFDYIGMRACHCLRGRNSIHLISDTQRRKPKCNPTLCYLTILPLGLPWAQRYRENDPCHLSTGDNPSLSPSIACDDCETYREVRVDVRIL